MESQAPIALGRWEKTLALATTWRRSPAVTQGVWVVGGLLSAQLLRLAGNLVLTRLLVPEAFGLMALVAAVAAGVNMLSDVGIRGGVIKSSRSQSAEFMETVWTLQVLRGGVIAGVLLAITVPVAAFYDEPALAAILPLWGINALLLGGKSVALYTYDKKLALKRQVVVELGTQVLGLVLMIAWAYYSPTVWALVAGTLFTTAASVAASYAFFDGHHSRLRWHPDTVREILGFGRWILISTALGYLVNQGDKVIMAAWLSMEELGVYAIASIMAAVVTLFVSTLSNRLLQPLYKRYIDEGRLRQVQASRIAVSSLFVAGCIVVSWSGEAIISLLYDPRYHQAGWMLQLLALRAMGISLNATLTAFLLANGNSFTQMRYQFVNTAVLVGGMFAGAQYGTFGIIAAYSLAPLLCHPYMVWLSRAHGVRSMRADLGLIFVAITLTVLGWVLADAPVLGQIVSAFH